MSSLLIIQVMIFVSLNNTKVTIGIRPNKKNVSTLSFVGVGEVPLYPSHVLLFTPKISLADFHQNMNPKCFIGTFSFLR